MLTIAAQMPRKRRVTSAEERELLAVKGELAASEAEVDRIRARRDSLISDLLDSGARQVDIAEILGLTERAVADARQRARRPA